MKSLLLFIANHLYKPLVQRYISGTTQYNYSGVNITVLPGVFHPQFFFSTKLLLGFLKRSTLRSKSFLELGAGSGLISLFAAKRGARVTATDISPTAIKNIQINQEKNTLFFPLVQSNLFDNLPECAFDLIVINPPYYKKDPVSEADHAWYCGKNSEYFTRLFAGLGNFMHAGTEVIMVLADVCDITGIKAIAEKQGFRFELISEHNKIIETNFIFSVKTDFTQLSVEAGRNVNAGYKQ